ncbi:hypothetical protein GC101_11235 [Paenibacillus sp. LMG 31459]|uniref:SLH domain-containing protein n=1 Tax=Paenibacillus phytohabitans TaxID=2654978 RepID=A0ABX1YEN1_9BACL|nr:S-layer homology domain-containing protein [Paenibacillus phytohabitans]NOU79450.1 hypothetical protein [Paenibacillus phytohabitans]
MIKRYCAALLTLILLLASLPLHPAHAAAEVNLDSIADITPGHAVTISGTTSLDTITLKVVTPSSAVLYLNVLEVSSGSFTDSFTVPADAEEGSYAVVVGKGEKVGVTGFNVKKEVVAPPTPSPTPVPSSTPAPTSTPVSTLSPGVPSAVLPSASASPVPTATPAISGTVEVIAQAATNGVFRAEVTEELLKAAIQGTTGNTLTLDMIGGQEARQLELVLPARLIKEALTRKIENLRIDTSIASLILSTRALAGNIPNEAKVISLTLTIADQSILTAETASKLGNHEIIHYSLAVDGQELSSAGAGITRLLLKYKLESGQNPGKVIAYAIDSSGKAIIIKNGRYNAASQQVEAVPAGYNTFSAVYSGVSFNDTAKLVWANSSIEALAARGIINGTGGGGFKPNAKVTRAEFIKMLMGTFDFQATDAELSFKDAAAGAWYSEAIRTAHSLGIVQGGADGNFGINAEISRQDIAVMIYRAAKVLNAELGADQAGIKFKDEQRIAAYAVEAVGRMHASGIINGVSAGNFDPQGKATRAQSAVIIYNLYNVIKQ